MQLHEALRAVGQLDRAAIERAKKRLDSLSKPLGSLGRLEDMVIQLAGITGKVFPCVDKKAVIIMCSDNGVVEEGVSQSGKEITAAVACNFMKGITGVNVLSRHSNADIVVVDIGMDADIEIEGILKKKIRKGTWNIAQGPAMTREEAVLAVNTGIGLVGDLKAKGYDLLGTGEMGIGNTTTSSAVASVLTGTSEELMVGRGAGLKHGDLQKKIYTVKKAIEISRPDPKDAIDVLAKVGGFDIAGLAGCFIGAAVHRIPILIDGFISSAAALSAVRIMPEVSGFLLPSHGSAEPGSGKVMEALGLEPYLNLGMRLGEGTGAALAFTHMGTFGDAGIEQYKTL
jgi:nicotinate-nucleotide--dimethylbenzimidazole phosphoribosyltransferase